VIIGHNQNIAWGVTNVGPDVQDLYIIHVNPDNPYQYEYNGEWRDMEIVPEVIHFGSAYDPKPDDPTTDGCEGISGLPINADGDLEIEVRVTHFGPIITDNAISDNCVFEARPEGKDPLALRWTALEPGDLFRAVIGVDRASNWSEFRQALTYWDWPSQNFVYADMEGNIGYQTPGHIPVRAGDHSGLVPVPGWTDEYEWRGYIPFDNLPRILNPERGWIVTANNAVVPPEYYDQLAETLGSQFGEDANYYLSQEWDYGYRARRIEEMVRSTEAHTVDTIAEIQGDNHNTNAEEILPYLLNISFDNAALTDAASWLAAWDLQDYMESPQAALFETYWSMLLHNLWKDHLGDYTEAAWSTRLLMDQPDSPWWDDPATDQVETRDDILVASLQDALDTMNANWGNDREKWRWGDLHRATFVSAPIGQSGISLLENLVNAGPVRVSGGTNIINATTWSPDDPFAVQTVSSMRMIVDLSDLENSRSIHTTGESGHPFSPHHEDMIDLWRHIDYHPMRFGDEAVNSAAESRLELYPGVGSHPAGE
jgi:penicillin amidase